MRQDEDKVPEDQVIKMREAAYKVQLKFSLSLWHSQLACGHGWHKATGSQWTSVFTAVCYVQNVPAS